MSTGLNPVTQSIQDAINLNEQARLLRMQRAWQAYHGDQPRPLRVRQGQPDDNIIANFSRVIVDKGISFLFGKPVSFAIEDEGAQTYLEQMWNANRQATFLHKLAMHGGICGHAFVKIVPAAAGAFPRFITLDPQLVHIETDPDDIETTTGYRIEWTGTDAQGRPLARRQLHQPKGRGWAIIDQQSPASSSGWITTGETAWPYPFPAIVDCQNLPCAGEVWGISDLEDDIRGLQGSINFALSNIGRILRFHAHPKTWGSGFQAQQLDVAPDQTIVLPSPDAKLGNLEMASDLGSSLELYRRLREALYEIARVPEVATGMLTNLGQLSGVALKVMYAPMTEKTTLKRGTYGDLLEELNRRALIIGGQGNYSDIQIHWPDLIPGDEMALAQTALLYKQVGVSDDTLMTRLGFDPEMEKKLTAEEQQNTQQLGDQLLGMFEKGVDRGATRPQ
ncbi:MAG: phage portal protein [Patescibacteria group bacterium]|nr:phage portal protein [Patescibacteria group bacterium]